MDRARSQETLDELARHFAGLFPGAECEKLDALLFQDAWGVVGPSRLDKQVKWSDAQRQLLVPLVDPATGNLAGGVQLGFDRHLDVTEIRVAKALIWVFNADVKIAPKLQANKELWLSLQQTRFSRAIGRYASFATDVVVRWLRNIENAATLKYEGKPFAIRLLICAKLDRVESSGLFEIVSLTQSIPVLKALFGSKWIRALSQSGDISLVALTSNVSIVGVLRPLVTGERKRALSPHTSLGDFCQTTQSKVLAIVASPSGDLFVVCPNGGTFLKRQGHWHFLNYAAVVALLRRYVDAKAELLAQTALDLSYSRKGALFVIPTEKASPRDIIPDFGNPGRANEELRSFAATLTLSEDDLSLIQDIAAIDGAVLIAADGQLLDCTCMVSRPEPDALKRAGLQKVEQFDGARTTAAWNASVHGLAIKISEDGPITFWERGRQVLAIG